MKGYYQITIYLFSYKFTTNPNGQNIWFVISFVYFGYTYFGGWILHGPHGNGRYLYISLRISRNGRCGILTSSLVWVEIEISPCKGICQIDAIEDIMHRSIHQNCKVNSCFDWVCFGLLVFRIYVRPNHGWFISIWSYFVKPHAT